MARVETIVVGGGINAGSPFTLNGIPFVSSVDPPFIATTDFLSVVPTGTNRGVIISTTGDPLVGTDRLRVKGGIVSEHADFTGTVVVGQVQTVTGLYANGFVFFGRNITISSASGANNIEPVVIGADISITGTSSAGGTSCVAIGSNIVVSGATVQNSVWIGGGVTDDSGSSTVVIGSSALNDTGQFSVVIGAGAQAIGSGSSCIVIGRSATKASGVASSVVVGDSAASAAGSSFSVVIGSAASCGAASGTICGESSVITHDHNILIGSGLASFQTNTCHIGQSRFSNVISTFVFGGNNTDSSAPAAYTMRFANQSGSNKNAPTVSVIAGLGTGTGTLSTIGFSTSVVAVSGTTQQTAQERMRLDSTVVAGNTAMLLWDADNATLERVTVGAADSGGVGFKLLRIPN